MPRPNRSDERRAEFLPTLARTFAELGYRRATTAALAERLGVQENTLFRLWPDKKAMFLASIDLIYRSTEAYWRALLAEAGRGEATAAERLLAHEARHHGQWKLYRIVFAGLSETDDPEIRRALARLFRRFHRFIAAQIDAHRGAGCLQPPAPEAAAWAVVGLGLMSDVVQELRLAPRRELESVFLEAGRLLLGPERPGE